jgi:hypothetical protein
VTFKRHPPKLAKQVDYTPRPRESVLRVNDGKARASVPVPKLSLVRDGAYLRAVAALPCVLCNLEGHSQAAHPNNGKGLGIKTSDSLAFPLCSVGGNSCHAKWDTYQFGRENQRAWEAIYAKWTQEKLADAGKTWKELA